MAKKGGKKWENVGKSGEKLEKVGKSGMAASVQGHGGHDGPSGCMLYNSFNSPSYTGRAGIMVTQMVYQEFLRPRTDSVHDRTVRRPSR